MVFGNSIIISSRDKALGVSPRSTGVVRKSKISEAPCPPPPTSPTALPSPPLSACPSSLILEFYKALRTRRAQCFGSIILLSAEELPGPKTRVEGPAYHEGGVQGVGRSRGGRRPGRRRGGCRLSGQLLSRLRGGCGFVLLGLQKGG